MKRLIVLVLVVAAGILAAAFTVPATAVSVNGVAVSQAHLDAQLSTIDSSQAFQCLLSAEQAVSTGGTSSPITTRGAGSGTYNVSFVDYWLSQLVTTHVVSQLVAERGLHVAPVALAAARADLLGSYQQALAAVEGSQYQCTTDPAGFVAALPGSLVRQQVQLESLDEVLLARRSTGVSSAQITQYYAAHTSRFDTLCVSAIVVPSSAAATKVEGELSSGTSFAAAAAANSTSTTSAAAGGAIGCYGPSSAQYLTLESDLKGLAVGAPSQPIQNSSGYLILELTSKRTAALPAVRAAVRTAVLEANTARVDAVIKQATRRADVTVNPQYGRWTPASVSNGVLPPLNPPAGAVLNPAANVATASTG